MTAYGPQLRLILLASVVAARLRPSDSLDGDYHTLAESVGALLQLIETPLTVTALVECWTEGQRLTLGSIGLRSGHHFWQFAARYPLVSSSVGDLNLNEDVVIHWLSLLDAGPEQHRTMVVVDLRCNGTKKLLAKAGRRLHSSLRWMVVDSRPSTYSTETYLDVLKPLPLLVSSEVFVVLREGNGLFRLVQVYKVSMNAALRTESIAVWSRNDSELKGRLIDMRESKVTSVRRKNLHGHTLRASMVITNPDTVNHLTDYKDKHIDTITKVNYLLTNCLAAYLGANVNYSRVSSWGYYNASTGMWDGMIGELVHDMADLGASPLFFTTDRIAVIEYLAMTSETRSKFIFRSPKLSYTENVFVLPFDNHVWICVVAVIAFSSLLLLVTLWAEWRVAPDGSGWTNGPVDASVLTADFRDTLLMIYGASCQQGSAVLPHSCSARTITMLTFTVLMFLYASYSANIVALLQSPSTKIQSLEDLLASRLKFGVHDTVFNRHYFTHATEPTRRALYEQKIRGPGGRDAFIPLEQGIDKIRQGLYAFHVEQGVGYKVISETYQEDEKCGLQEIQYLQVVDPYYAIQKNSSYKEMVKIGLFRLNEHGIQYRENAKLYTKKPSCSGGGGKFVPVSMVDVEPAVWIILWGAGLAAAFFLVERIYFRVTRGTTTKSIRHCLRNNSRHTNILKERETGAHRRNNYCAICLESIENDKTFLGCTHAFHRPCIDLWFMRRNSCPICRWKEDETMRTDSEDDEAGYVELEDDEMASDDELYDEHNEANSSNSADEASSGTDREEIFVMTEDLEEDQSDAGYEESQESELYSEDEEVSHNLFESDDTSSGTDSEDISEDLEDATENLEATTEYLERSIRY